MRTKRRAEAIDKAEEMYFDLQNELKDGRKLFSVSIADAVAIYLEHRKIDVRTKEIAEGRWVTIRAHAITLLSTLAKQVGIEVEQRNTEEEEEWMLLTNVGWCTLLLVERKK